MKPSKMLPFVIIGTLLSLTLISCGGGGGGGGGTRAGDVGGGGNPPATATVITGYVVDGFVAGATVTAYKVNADGTQGPQIGTPAATDQSGNYTLNLGTFNGPVYLVSRGGTYTDTATGTLIDLTNSALTFSAIIPNAAGTVAAQINPLTTMAAQVASTLASQGSPLTTAAANGNTLIQNYFGLTSSILSTALLDLTKADCMAGAGQPNVDISAILAGISQLAKTYGVSAPDLVSALTQDVTSDGQFDGSASGTTISVMPISGPPAIPLSTIEGNALTGLATAITSFMNSTASNVCGAPQPSPAVITDLQSNASLFTVPAAPTGVQVTAENGAAVISWNGVTGATQYNLYVATAPGVTPTSTQLPGFMSVPMWKSPYALSKDLASTTYYFVVTAVSGTSPFMGHESAPSAEVSAAVLASKLPAQWAATTTAGNDQSSLSSVAAATDGSAYAAGYITGSGTYSFGTGVSAAGTYASGLNAVLVKYNSQGQAQWAMSMTQGADDSYFYGISVAQDGSVYAAGYIYGSGAFGFGNGISIAGPATGHSYDPVLVKYDTNGNAQWARTLTAGTGGSYFFGVSAAQDGTGAVYAAGWIFGNGTYTFGTNATVTVTNNSDNVVLVKYDASGNAQWARTVTGSSDSTFQGVSAAPDGSVYAAGFITGNGAYTFGSGVAATGTFPNGINAVLVKYDTNGNAQWAQTPSGTDYSNFYSVSAATDGSGAVYAAGDIHGTGAFTFGAGAAAAGTYSGFNPVLVQYSGAGAVQWARTVTTGSNESEFSIVSAAPDGSVFAAGYITGTGTFTFGTNAAATGINSGKSVVIVQYDPFGTAKWAPTMLSVNGSSQFNGAVAASGSAVYAVGQIFGYGNGVSDFGNGATALGTCQFNNTALVKYTYAGLGSLAVTWQ